MKRKLEASMAVRPGGFSDLYTSEAGTLQFGIGIAMEVGCRNLPTNYSMTVEVGTIVEDEELL